MSHVDGEEVRLAIAIGGEGICGRAKPCKEISVRGADALPKEDLRSHGQHALDRFPGASCSIVGCVQRRLLGCMWACNNKWTNIPQAHIGILPSSAPHTTNNVLIRWRRSSAQDNRAGWICSWWISATALHSLLSSGSVLPLLHLPRGCNGYKSACRGYAPLRATRSSRSCIRWRQARWI
jgi:hypothetical protein